MSKTTNSQKVIEAEANLQTAKMLEGIQNLSASLNLFEKKVKTNWNTSVEKSIEEIFEPILYLKDLMLLVHNTKKSCALSENIKLVEDITKGIQLKAKYEMRINELETAISVANSNNLNLESSINDLKKNFNDLIQKIINDGVKVDKEIIEAFMIKYSTNLMEKSVNFAVRESVKKILSDKKIQCEANDLPF